MENFEPEFIKNKYWNKEEFRDATEQTAKRTKKRRGEKVSQKPQDKITNYLERFQEITDREDPEQRQRGVDAIEHLIDKKYIIKPKNIPDEYIKGILLGNEAEFLGYERDSIKDEQVKQTILASLEKKINNKLDTYQIPPEHRKQLEDMIITDQTSRIHDWLAYLTSQEVQDIPLSFRYWAFAEVLKQGDYDPTRGEYNRRTTETVANFPELDQQALALVFDEVERKYTHKPSTLQITDEQKQQEFKELLKTENFGRLYAFMQKHVNFLRLPSERLMITDGEWKIFSKGSSPTELTTTLQGFQTKWCIAGEGYATTYLKDSDVHIYFSKDIDGQNTIPRACIVDKEQHGITEVRGIIFNENAKQHLDDYIAPVVADKLKSMEGGEKWQTQMEDMKKLSEIHFKYLQGELLSKKELVFLYEIDKPIKNSGYGKDPRIEEILSKRNKMEDATTIFECTREQIATNQSEVNENTKAYIGEWNPTIFKTIKQFPNIIHLYESFPDKKLFIYTLETDTTLNKDNATTKLEEKGIVFWDYTKNLISKTEFSGKQETYNLVQFTVEQLGFPNGATTDEIYAKAQKLGLELCPPEVGPQLRLAYPGKDWKLIAMKQITDRDGGPNVFDLDFDGGRLGLGGIDARPDDRWDAGNPWVFRFRK